MNGRERAFVTRVHCLQHVESLGPSNLADDDPVRTHAQGVADEVADGHLTFPLDVLRPGLEPHDMSLLELKLCGVLDRDDAIGVGHRC